MGRLPKGHLRWPALFATRTMDVTPITRRFQTGSVLLRR